MAEMMKMSEAANLALHGMALLAAKRNLILSSKEMASKMKVSQAHLIKVMQRLMIKGYVRSQKGRNGGYLLKGSSDNITLLDIYEAVEGKLVSRRCLLGRPICDGTNCILGKLTVEIDRIVRKHLSKAKLSESAKILKELIF